MAHSTPASNPSFPLTIAQAREELARMRADPRPLVRPLLILNGYLGPHFVIRALERRFRQLTGDPRTLAVSFTFASSFNTTRRRTIEAVRRVWPGAIADGTSGKAQPVDVVGLSMGGLVARHAALAQPDTPGRLRIARLFTLGSPHRGAALAPLPALTTLQRSMRAGSTFLEQLDAASHEPDYALVPYARLRDRIVGPANSAPPGATPIWVPNTPGQFAHLMIWRDPRLIADIARRLRGEPPLAHEPRAPLPTGTR